MLVIRLQRFAGEKTERATPQRRARARREGQIPKSAELTSAMGLVAVMIALKVIGPYIWQSWTDMFQQQLQLTQVPDMSIQNAMGLFRQEAWIFIRLTFPVVGIAMLVGVATAVSQVGFQFLPKHIAPDFQRVQPLAGLKRMFSLRSLVELLKSLLKLSIFGGIAYAASSGIANKLGSLMSTDIRALTGTVGNTVFQIGIEISIAMLLLAVFDFVYQRFEFERSIRMSRQDIKDEMKQSEGDPLVRSHIRQRGRALAMRRMMQEVPKADVIITNPTHFAVAIRYDAAKMAAPVVVAKGADELAWRIRQLADKAGVPRVENRPLAQAMYRTVEVGDAVPADLYKAVAEVLAYVYRLRREGG